MPAGRVAARNRMQNWEIIADKLSKAGWELGLRLRRGFQRANNFVADALAAKA
jgi:hypothetical protein